MNQAQELLNLTTIKIIRLQFWLRMDQQSKQLITLNIFVRGFTAQARTF